MGVDAIYLLDEKKQIRRAIVWSVYEMIGDEAAYLLTAQIDSGYGARPGEFIAFCDGDDRLKMYEIEEAEKDEARGVTTITATDAAVSELAHSIVPEIRLESATALEGAQAALEGSGFDIGRHEDPAQKRSAVSAYRETRWKALRTIATDFSMRVTAYYAIDNGKIAGKRVDVYPRENVFRGRIFEGDGQAKIYIKKSGVPLSRMYGVGRATGTQDPPECVTIAEAVWSKANGDPADKPAGQLYIEDAEAAALYGEGREGVYTDKNETDPQALLQSTWEELKKRRQPQVSGTATAADLRDAPGFEHMRVELYDMVYVRTRDGEDAQAAVIGIKRNYLSSARTKITIGEEAQDVSLVKKIAQLSGASKAQSRSSESSRNRYIEAKQLIQLNANTIQMNAELIEANAEKIRMMASNIEQYAAGTDERLTMAELTLYGDGTSANAGLSATVEAQGEQISQAALTLYGDGTSANAGLNARVGENEAAIMLHASDLGTLFEVKADRADLGSYATVTRLEAEVASIKNEFTYQQAVQHLYAAATFTYQGFLLERKTATVITSIGVTKEYVTVPGANGVSYVAIGGLTVSPREEEISYLAWM